MSYELWDGELGFRVGTYESESEALAAVRSLLERGQGSAAPLGLVADGRALVASGEELARRALGGRPSAIGNGPLTATAEG